MHITNPGCWQQLLALALDITFLSPTKVHSSGSLPLEMARAWWLRERQIA